MIINSLEVKSKILDSFLNQVSVFGWSKKNLDEALIINEIKPSQLELIFENGLFELTEFFIKEKICGNVEQLKLNGSYLELVKTDQKITFLLEKTFEFLAKNYLLMLDMSHFIADLNNFLPKNLLNFSSKNSSLKPAWLGLKLSYIVSDAMWKAIDDQSTDFNYYSKRIILSKIILRSFFVFLKDEPSNLNKTKLVIKQEISRVISFAKNKKFLIEKGKKHFELLAKAFLTQENNLKTCRELASSLPFIRLFVRN
jgi:ubiquinone biosynthesis protein COQ9